METKTTGLFKNRQLLRATGFNVVVHQKTKNNWPFGEESGIILVEL